MTEPTNPLFEDEKEFLERKKLEYERALRGDVAEIKEQTLQVGKVALVGAGVVGGIWLLVKAFGGRKHKKKHKKHRPQFDDYAGSGFDGYDEDETELDGLATDFQDPEYAYEHADTAASEDGFYSEGRLERADDFGDADADDDNGLSDYPDFPAHSTTQHGYEVTDETSEDFATTYGDASESPVAHSYASANSYQARPYDDSRRLPDSEEFAEEESATNEEASQVVTPKRSPFGPALLAFAKSETGRVVVAQAAALALALATKAIHGILPQNEEETDKNADLAGSSAHPGIPPATWPATTAAQDVSAAAHHDDNPATRAPLAG